MIHLPRQLRSSLILYFLTVFNFSSQHLPIPDIASLGQPEPKIHDYRDFICSIFYCILSTHMDAWHTVGAW